MSTTQLYAWSCISQKFTPNISAIASPVAGKYHEKGQGIPEAVLIVILQDKA